MRGRQPLRALCSRGAGFAIFLALLAGASLGTGSAAPRENLESTRSREDPRREAFRLEIGRAWPPVSQECLARALTGALPGAPEWSALRSLAWPAGDGPRASLWDRLESELESRAASSLCIHPREPAAFALDVPDAWNVRSGRDWLIARAREGDLALEAVALPSVYSPVALARRSLSLLERNRRVHVQVLEQRASEIAGHAAFSVVLQFRVHGREVRVRATWIRLGPRVVRVMGVAEVEAEWREPGLLERIEGSLRARVAPAE